MFGSCYSWSSRRYGRITLQLLQNVTAFRLSRLFLTGGVCRELTRWPLSPTGRGATVRWLSQSISAHEKKASPSLSVLQKYTLLDPSSPHKSLESFHAYALRTGLSPTSTVYTGTAYEYLAKSTLQPYGFNLHRVGGRGDRGVDLVGVLEIPVLSRLGDWKEKKSNAATYEHDFLGPEEFKGVETHQLKLLVQCKRLAGRHARIGPNLIRELDGAIRAARSATLVDMIYPQTKAAGTTTEDRHRGSNAGEETRESNLSAGPAIGVLVGTRPATKGVVDSMSRSTRGLVWIMMEEVADQDTGGKEIRPPSRSESMSPLHSDISPPDTGESPSDSEPEPGRSSGPPGKPPHSAANLKGRIKQILWNQAAREAGLEGVDVVKRYDSEGKEEVVLMRGGRVWGGS